MTYSVSPLPAWNRKVHGRPGWAGFNGLNFFSYQQLIVKQSYALRFSTVTQVPAAPRFSSVVYI